MKVDGYVMRVVRVGSDDGCVMRVMVGSEGG